MCLFPSVFHEAATTGPHSEATAPGGGSSGRAGTANDTEQAFADIVAQRWHASANHQRMEPMHKTKPVDAIRTENGLSYSVRIDARFGSQFQRTVAIKNLNNMLAAWKELIESQHKKNAIAVIRTKD
jgi:hypothetical protein